MKQIGQWPESRLMKFVRDQIDNAPPSYLPNAKIEELTVAGTLTVEDAIEFTKNANFLTFGQQGAPAFTNGWTRYGSPYFDPAVWRDPLGFTVLRGAAKSGTMNLSLATLAPIHRPEMNMEFTVPSNGALGVVVVNADGTIVPAVGSNARISLDGIRFKAAV